MAGRLSLLGCVTQLENHKGELGKVSPASALPGVTVKVGWDFLSS